MADTDFSTALTAALKTYADGVAEAVDEAAERCAKGLAKELRGTSPKRTGAYAKGWAAKQTGTSERGGKTFTVYNKTRYQLKDRFGTAPRERRRVARLCNPARGLFCAAWKRRPVHGRTVLEQRRRL